MFFEHKYFRQWCQECHAVADVCSHGKVQYLHNGHILFTQKLMVAKFIATCDLTAHWSSFCETGFHRMLTRNSFLMPNSRPASNIWEPPQGTLWFTFVPCCRHHVSLAGILGLMILIMRQKNWNWDHSSTSRVSDIVIVAMKMSSRPKMSSKESQGIVYWRNCFRRGTPVGMGWHWVFCKSSE